MRRYIAEIDYRGDIDVDLTDYLIKAAETALDSALEDGVIEEWLSFSVKEDS